MRMYQPAWNLLKRELQIQISAKPNLHARIYKAIRKEKDMDTIYKMECADRGESATLSSTSSGLILTIQMHITTSTKNLNAHNLGIS